jgi:hypothetical protein
MTEPIAFEDRIAEQLRAYAAPAARPPRREAVANAVEAARTVHGVQHRSWWRAWGSNHVNTSVKLIVAAAAVLVVAVAGYQLLPRNGGIGGQPTIAPSPSPVLIARGSFREHDFGPVDFEASRVGSRVTGRMTWSEHDGWGMVTVDLQCMRETENGIVMIGGYITVGNRIWAAGEPALVVIQRGSPPRGNVRAGSPTGEPATQTTDCLANLDAWLQDMRANLGDAWIPNLVRVGDIEFGP